MEDRSQPFDPQFSILVLNSQSSILDPLFSPFLHLLDDLAQLAEPLPPPEQLGERQRCLNCADYFP
jgi:hypothetical protein